MLVWKVISDTNLQVCCYLCHSDYLQQCVIVEVGEFVD